MSKQQETLILQVVDLARSGAGVAREESGRVVFIPFTAPGDRVRVRITKADKRYAEAELVEILTPSPVRVVPRCSAFQKCGGCQWQHLPYGLQWETKLKGVKHALARVGVELPRDLLGGLTELPAEQVWEYRNRVQARGFQGEMGFYAARTNTVVPLDRCEIARPEINAAWEQVRREGAKLPKPFKVEIEVLLGDGIRQTRWFWNARHAAGGFRQVHDDQNEKLQSFVGEALRPREGERPVLLDLFGGAGNLSLPIAGRFSEVHCVDLSVPQAAPGVPANYCFHASPVLRWLLKNRDRRWPGGVFAVLDPPREGLGAEFGEIASSLARLGASRVVLVGCDPDSWARDVSRFLKAQGWALATAAVLDLFPQTPHVESIAVFNAIPAL